MRSTSGRAASDRAGSFAGLVGEHRSMLEAKHRIEQFSRMDGIVLILGESGSGKELVARALHEMGPRRDEPFLAVNCGAIPRSLLEDELFGHVAGAFTGADRERQGLFVAAGEGTLFLDEIAELDLELQVKLLRTLEERQVTPLGSNEPVPWKARVVCATNKDLRRAVAEGTFREDLFYRVNVLEQRLAALRERKEDIPLLVDHFLTELAREGGSRKRFAAEALDMLANHSWPGNVRELHNVVASANALCRGDVIEPHDLPEEIRRAAPSPAGRAAGGFPPMEAVIKRHIVEALARTGGHRTRAAQLLEVNRNRLARWIAKYNIEEENPELFSGRRRESGGKGRMN